TLARAVRAGLQTLPLALPGASGQPQPRPAPRRLVCAEPSYRGLCRNLRGLACAAIGLAAPLRRVARTAQAPLRAAVRTGARRTPPAGALPRAHRASGREPAHAGAVLPGQAGARTHAPRHAGGPAAQ